MSNGAAGSTVSESQVEAMISLLSDTSEEVVRRCREALVANARMAEPLLRERLGQARGDEVALLRRTLADVTGPVVEQELVDHLLEKPDLERGSILIGRLVDGGDGPAGVSAALDAMGDQVAAQLGGRRNGVKDLAVLRDVLVDQNGLQPARVGSARPIDAVLHGVTSRRRGIPLPLCMTWLLVARRVRLPLLGVDMPGHFLVRYGAGDDLLLLDPYRRGLPVDPGSCLRFLRGQGHDVTDLRDLDATDLGMLLRTLRNLLSLASGLGDQPLAERCGRVLRAASTAYGT